MAREVLRNKLKIKLRSYQVDDYNTLTRYEFELGQKKIVHEEAYEE